MSKIASKTKPNLSASAESLDNPWPARLTQLAFILSLAVVVGFALAMAGLAARVFTRTAVC